MIKRFLVLLAAVLVLPALTNSADAKPRKKHRSYSSSQVSSIGHYGPAGYVMAPKAERRRSARRSASRRSTYRSEERMSLGYSNYSSGSRRTYSGGAGPRPSKWCGWWMRTQRGGG
ncbi:MAG: hypothetical protein KDJ18_13385, partial [Hyphomicrobiaceae bacterium]|nr:hypothetical protein [Hyphomicrobiaceae bacterium]